MSQSPEVGLSEEQLTELFLLTKSRMLSRFYRMGLGHVADDLYQDTFRKMLSTTSIFQGKSQATTYLMAAGINVGIDYIRKERSARNPFVDLAMDPELQSAVLEGVDFGADPALHALANEREARLRVLFAGLDPDDQRLLALESDGVSSAAIATLTGLSRPAIHSRLSRLKRRLKEETSC